MNTLTQQQINQYQWQVADGVARVVNPFDSEYKNKTVREIGGFEKAADVSKNYAAFEKKFGNICFTSNAPDGIYSGEAFELVWQYNYFGSSYIDVTDDCYEQYNHDYNKWAKPTDIAVRCRLFLRLKPSHLPAVLTTKPGEEWKDRYKEVWYVQDRGNLDWTKITRQAIYDNYTFERYAALQFDIQDQATKREWHLNTPPAEQEPETVYPNQDLFNHMSQEHGLTLTQSEIAEIIHIVEQSTLTQKDQRIAELEREREWISVEDRLPEGQTEVLVYMPKYGSDMNVYFLTDLDPERKTWFNCFFDTKPFSDVTHWMPLPTPPQH